MNPFLYDRPVPPQDLVDRTAEARQLVELAEGGHATRLSAPRRYGKTSLIGRVLRDAEALGMNTVLVDFFGVVSTADVAARIEDAYRKRLQGPARRLGANLLRVLRPTVRAGVPGVGISVQPGSDEDARRLLGRLLDLPVPVFERTGQRTLVVFDEVQALLGAGEQLDAVVRSHIQHHGDAAAYLFAGSEPTLMRQLFDTRERPLYGQARPVRLGPLPDDELADYIQERFRQNGRDVVWPALEALLELAQGHPQRAMLLAHHLYEHTSPDVPADEETWIAARTAAMSELQEAFEIQWSGLSRPERAVVSALAEGQASLLSAAVIDRYGVSKSSLAATRDRLADGGVVLHRSNAHLAFVDPLFAAWIYEQRADRDRP